MSIELKAPHYPESVEEGTLAKWYKNGGDFVQRDEKVADIETDKIVLEVMAPDSGMLTGVLKKEGDTVLDGETLAIIDAGATPASPPPTPATEPEPAKVEEPSSVAALPEPKAAPGTPPLSPAVRKLLTENDLDPASVTGTGKDGRVTKSDVVNFMKSRTAPPSEAKAAPRLPSDPRGRTEERVAMTRLRARVAERLVEAQHTTAMLTTFNEVNMQPVMSLRKRHKERFEKNHGVRLGFMSFFVKAAVEALKEFPAVNASVDGKEIVYHGYFDIGVAVSSPRGLVVPVVRDADALSFAGIESGIENLANRARDGQLTLEELTGGTFTITNGGVFGSLLSTPILNPPQSAILGMHRIQERPVAENGEVVIRPVMYLALSYDHRIVDGREAVLFLVRIKEVLEDPARLLLQV